jgi:hypothetical protein
MSLIKILDAQTIRKTADLICANYTSDHVAALSAADIVSAFDDLAAKYQPLINACVYPGLVSCDVNVRLASEAASARIDSVIAECTGLKSISRALNAYNGVYADKPIHKKLLDTYDGTPPEQSSELAGLCRGYANAIRQRPTIELTAVELTGSNIQPGTIELTTSTYKHIMLHCSHRPTREKTYKLYNGWPAENASLLADMCSVRQKINRQPTSFLTDDPTKLLNTVYDLLKPLAKQYVGLLNVHAAANNHTLECWDVAWFGEKLTPAGPLTTPQHALTVALQWFGEKTKLEFCWVRCDFAGADTTTSYLVKDSHGVIGEIHFDLFARPNKHGHPCEVCIAPGGKGRPIALVIACFRDQITHAECKSLFHEIGHALNDVMYNGTTTLTAGTTTEQDFVEIIAVCAESAVRDKRVLQALYPGCKVDHLTSFGPAQAFDFLPRITTALFDAEIHNGPTDIDAAWQRHKAKDLVWSAANFSYRSHVHWATGYAAKYYSYTLAAVVAATMVFGDATSLKILTSGSTLFGRDMAAVDLGPFASLYGLKYDGAHDIHKDLTLQPASKFENLTRLKFETLTGHKFPTVYPSWLIYKRRQLELDGYNSKLHLAFECQGPQHTGFTKMDPAYHRYLRRLENDAAKKRLCELRGVGLCIIDHVVPKQILGSYIRSRIYDVACWWTANGWSDRAAALGHLAVKAPDYVDKWTVDATNQLGEKIEMQQPN